ncbi:MAG: hypothetical protein ACT4P8_04015 [Betaproteobacteria bacterium]
MNRTLYALGLFVAATANLGAAEPLGRLFYTPAQRSQLDTLRAQKNVAPPAQEAKEPAAAPEVVTYGGIVRRSDGKSTVWINNRMMNDGKPLDDLSISSRRRADDRVSVSLPQVPGTVELRVGQSFDVQTGSVSEPFTRRARDSVPHAAKELPPPPAKSDPPRDARRDTDEEDGERSRR